MDHFLGANADHRYGVRPGDEFRIAAALAYELFVNRRLGRLGQDNAVASALLGYKPESIAQEVGFDVRVIRELAIELWEKLNGAADGCISEREDNELI
jgi:hypothetical protein